MPTKEQLENENTGLQISLDDAIAEIKRLKQFIKTTECGLDGAENTIRNLNQLCNVLKDKTLRMRNTMADKDQEILGLKCMMKDEKHKHTIPEGTCSLG